jgi:hypothetical protein
MGNKAMVGSAVALGALAGALYFSLPAGAQTQPPPTPDAQPAVQQPAVQQPAPTQPAPTQPGVAPGQTTPGTPNPFGTNPFTNPFVPSPFFVPGGQFLTPADSIAPGATSSVVPGTGTSTNNGFLNPFFLPGSGLGTDSFFFNPFFTRFTSPFGVASLTPNAGTVLGPTGSIISPLPRPVGRTLGVNALPHTAGGGPVPYVHTAGAFVATSPLNSGGQVPGPAGSGGPPAVTAVPAGTATTTTTTATTVASNPASVRVARRLEALMRQQAMIPGHLVKLGATGATVRINRNGKLLERSFALSDVFFFSGEGVLDAATAPERLHTGDVVLVPERNGKPV